MVVFNVLAVVIVVAGLLVDVVLTVVLLEGLAVVVVLDVVVVVGLTIVLDVVGLSSDEVVVLAIILAVVVGVLLVVVATVAGFLVVWASYFFHHQIIMRHIMNELPKKTWNRLKLKREMSKQLTMATTRQTATRMTKIGNDFIFYLGDCRGL